jgi:hypothetical protein
MTIEPPKRTALGSSFGSRVRTMPRHRAQVRTQGETGTLAGQVFMTSSVSPLIEVGAAKQFPFYQEVADMTKKQVGVNVFLPHRDVLQATGYSRIYDQIHRAIAKSDLVLVDIGTPSIDIGMMIGIAKRLTRPFIPFYRTNSRINPDPFIQALANYDSRVEIFSDEQGIRDLVTAVKSAYRK